MVSRIERVSDDLECPTQGHNDRPHVNFYESSEVEDLCTDPNFLDLMCFEQYNDVVASIYEMVRIGHDSGLSKENNDRLQKILCENQDLLRVSLSQVPAADIEPLKF